jgi:hypothetical protein
MKSPTPRTMSTIGLAVVVVFSMLVLLGVVHIGAQQQSSVPVALPRPPRDV